MELKTQVTQKMTLSANMQQCLEILAMDNMQLSEFIAEQSMENPILELSDADAWEKDYFAVVHIEREHTGEDEDSGISRIAAGENPNSDLYFQLSDYILPLDVRRAAEYIIESLDERGYFTDSPEVSAKVLKTSVKTVREALKIVKRLEPKGIGAADLRECLLIQLEEKYPREETAKEILEQYLDDFARGRYERIAKKTGRSREQIKKAGDIIRSLEPKPLGSRKPSVRTGYITADLALVGYEDYYDIVFNPTHLPEIHFNSAYIDMLKDDTDEETKQYLFERYEKAKWLKSCVRRRQKTLLMIAELIFKNQEEFLLSGPAGIRPLTLKQIADETGMNISTVSRAVKDKYIQTRWGIYPLRYFFGGGIRTEEGAVSSAKIRAALARMIEKEDKAHPLSDSKLERLLKERGMSVSRRTVAAYREQMNIPASPARREKQI